MNKRINVLLIGYGPHARRIYVPALERLLDQGVRLSGVVELESNRGIVSERFAELPTIFVSGSDDAQSAVLSDGLICQLDKLVKREKIDGVIISTEPRAHAAYAKWAINRELHVLMDKPISTEAAASTDPMQAKKILLVYEELVAAYSERRSSGSKASFTIMAQRRYHPLFSTVRDRIGEVFARTGCPITSVQLYHSDGQWCLPHEIVHQRYHPYNEGYGKASHSGYHFFDLVNWFCSSTERNGKKLDTLRLSAQAVRPSDMMHTFTPDDYRNLFPDFDTYHGMAANELVANGRRYGEIDITVQAAAYSEGHVQCLINIGLFHTGFARRNWIDSTGRDLYKGNGRVRHESHIIQQGPFQTIHIHSFQSGEISETASMAAEDQISIGGEYHLDAHVFRNERVVPTWKNYEMISSSDLHGGQSFERYSRVHQEDARMNSVRDFIKNIGLERSSLISDLTDHKRSVQQMSSSYLSLARLHCGRSEVVTTSFIR